MNKEGSTIANWALVIAVLSAIISVCVFVDTTFITDIDVYVGKHARLHVVVDTTVNPPLRLPAVFLTLTFVNDGGRLGAVTDTKLLATIECNDTAHKVVVQFESIREIDNILLAERNSPRKGIATVPILGKSTEIKKYAYVPRSDYVWDTSCTSFDMVFDLQVNHGEGWVTKRVYRLSSDSGVWCDLYQGGEFKSQVVEVSQVSN